MGSTAALELLVSLNDKASKGLDSIASKGGFLSSALSFAAGGLIQKGIEGISGAIGDLFTGGLEQASQWNQAMGQVDATLKSTGGSAGVTRDKVMELANSLSAGNGMSRAADDAIASGEGLLLTFTGIGAQVFPQATQAMLDMTTAMAGGAAPSAEALKGTALQLGKALNDPIKGITALSRAGVSFSESQKETIKSMVAVGNTAGAQKLILGELTKEFGGSAAASAKTFAGSMDVLSEKFNNVKQSVGEALMPAIQQAVGLLASPAVMGAVQQFADGIASGITNAIPIVTGLFQQFGPVIITVFQNIWATLSPIIAQLGSLFIQTIPTAIAVLSGVFNGILMPVFQAVSSFIVGTIVPAFSQFVQWLSGFLPTAISIVSGLLQTVIIPIFQTVATIVVNNVIPAFEQIASWLGQVLPPVISALGYIWSGLQPILIAVANIVSTVVLPALLSIGTQIMGYVVPVLQFIGDVVTTLVYAWQTNWGNIQTIIGAVAQVIWFNIQLVWGVIKGLADAIGTLLKPIADAFHWLAGQAGKDGKDTGDNYTGNMVSGLNGGIPNINTNINGIGTNLAALQAPAGTYGTNIGGNWIGGVNNGVAGGMGSLNNKISAIRASLATLSAMDPNSVNTVWTPGAPSTTVTGKDPYTQGVLNGVLSGPTRPQDKQVQLHTVEDQKKLVQQQLDNYLDDQREDLTHAALQGIQQTQNQLNSVLNPLNLFGGVTGGGGTPPVGGGGGSGGGSGGSGSGAKSAVQDAITAAADMTSKISQAVTAGITALGQLTNFTLPSGFTQGVENFAQGVNAVMQRMQQVALSFKDDMLVHTSSFLDTAQKAMTLVSAGVDALAKLKDFKKPTDDSMNAFTDAIQYMIGRLGDIAAKWSIDSLAILGLFSDSTAKAMTMVSTAIDALTKLKDFKKPSDEAMRSFVDALDYLTDMLRRVVAKWDANSLTLAATFGESIGKLITGIGAAIDVLSKLVGFKKPANDSVDQFFAALDNVTQRISDRARNWYGLVNESVVAVAGYIGAAVNGLLGAVEGLSKLADPNNLMPTGASIDAFFTSLDLIAPKVSDRARNWYGLINDDIANLAGFVGKAVTGILGAVDGLSKLASDATKFPAQDRIDAFFAALDLIIPEITSRSRDWYGLINESIADVASAIGKAVTGLLGAVDGFTKLASKDFQAPTLAQIDAFFAALDLIVPMISDRTRNWYGLINEDIAKLAGYVGASVTGITAAIDPLTKLATFVSPPKENIEAFFQSLVDFITIFGQRAADFQGQASTLTAELATNIGLIADGISKAIDPLLHIADAAKVDPKQIEAAFSNIWQMLNQFGVVMAGLPADFAGKAGAFAGAVSSIFGAIKAGFDVAAGVDGKTGGSIGDGFATALAKAQDLVGYLTGTATTAMGTFGTATTTLQTTVVGAWDAMTAAVGRYIGEVGKLPAGTTPPGGDNGKPPFNIPGFATGGIVNSRTLAWVGENGPEAIIPLSKMGSGSGGGDIYLTVNAGFGADSERIKESVLDVIEQALGRRKRDAGMTGSAA